MSAETCAVCTEPVDKNTQAYDRETVTIWHIECFRDLQGNLVNYEIAMAEYKAIDWCQDAFWNCDTCLCEDDPQRHVLQHKHSPVQAWFDSGPIKEETLATWLSILKEDTNG
jgi:hypothetical protein